MKKDIYKNAMNKIKASDKAKADSKALFDTVNSANTDNVISIKNKTHKRNSRFVAVLAASLAIVFALSAVADLSGIPITENSNSFILTVGAEEITDIPLVLPDEVHHGTISLVSYSLPFPIVCKGENIESITYSIENALFINNSNKMVASSLYGKKFDGYGALNSYPIYDNQENLIPLNAYTSYTVNYANQDNPDEYFPEVAGGIDLLENNDETITAEIIKELTEQLFEDMKSDNFDNNKAMKLRKQIMDLYLKDVDLTVTVKFSDGTTQKQNVKIGYEMGNYKYYDENSEYHEDEELLDTYTTYTLE